MKRRVRKKRNRTVFMLRYADSSRATELTARKARHHLATADVNTEEALLAVRMGYLFIGERYSLWLKKTHEGGQYHGILLEGQTQPQSFGKAVRDVPGRIARERASSCVSTGVHLGSELAPT